MSIVPRDPYEPITAEMWAELRARYPHPQRIAVAMKLADDVETCEALLRGDPVDPDRVNTEALREARDRKLVRLDLCAIDLLKEAAA